MITQFWACWFKTEDLFFEFLGEDDDFWLEENEDTDYPLSKFAASQGGTWYDHDYMECGFNDVEADISKQFWEYSFNSEWYQEFFKRAEQKGMKRVNSFIMSGIDIRRKKKKYLQFENPVSSVGDNFEIIYIGEITHGWGR